MVSSSLSLLEVADDLPDFLTCGLTVFFCGASDLNVLYATIMVAYLFRGGLSFLLRWFVDQDGELRITLRNDKHSVGKYLGKVTNVLRDL